MNSQRRVPFHSLAIVLLFCSPLWAIELRKDHLEADLDANAAGETQILPILDALPDEFFKPDNFLINYAPEGRQKGIRVLLTNDTGEKTFAYTVDRKAKHFNTFEMIGWNHDESGFYGRDWDPRRPPKEKLSAINPSECLGCHKGNISELGPRSFRANYDSYPHWDKYFGNAVYANAQTEKSGSYYFPTEAVEKWAEFSKTAKDDPLLRRLKEHLPLFEDPDAPKEELMSEYRTKVIPALSGALDTYNSRLDRLNSKRVARILKETRALEPWKFAVLAALGQCENLPEFFSKPVRKKFEKIFAENKIRFTKTYEQEVKERTESTLESDRGTGRIQEYWPQKDRTPEMYIGHSSNNIVPLSSLAALFELAGADSETMSAWSMSFHATTEFGPNRYFWIRQMKSHDEKTGALIDDKKSNGVFEDYLIDNKIDASKYYVTDSVRNSGSTRIEYVSANCKALKEEFEKLHKVGATKSGPSVNSIAGHGLNKKVPF